MDDVVRSFFTEALDNAALQSQLDPIWIRYEEAETAQESQESIDQLINLAGMHGFKFTAVELDDVMQEAMEDEFLEVQSGEKELSDADLDLVAAGKAGRVGRNIPNRRSRRSLHCRRLWLHNRRAWKRLCRRSRRRR